MARWTRPQSVKFPSIWSEFEGKVEVNGKKRKYWIQDVSEEYQDDLVNLMCTQFLKDEPVCKYSNLLEDELSLKEIRELWYGMFSQKLALICLTKDENNDIVIAGANMTGISLKHDKEELQIKGQKWKAVYDSVDYISNLKDVYEVMKSDSYLTAMGLLVMPEFRGDGLGLALLNARRNLSLAVGIKASATCFTSIISQKVATKAGFKDFAEMSYDELEKIRPHCVFPGITNFTKTIKFMYIIYN